MVDRWGHGAAAETLSFSKHHGAGNDFLVFVDPADRIRLPESVVVALCDRYRGVGADGLVRVWPGEGTDLSMELHNADGGRAEMSGNGIRCVAQAAVDAGLADPPRLTVATDAGVRTVEYRAVGAGAGWARVDMGPATLGEEQVSLLGQGPARRVDVGNPHLVVLHDGVDLLDVAGLGRRISGTVPGGLNVEFVSVVGDGDLRMRVWERGVGETRACGTGSVAAAAAARAWGLTGSVVCVQNPGGPLEVELGEDGAGAGAPSAWLAGPTHKVADLTADPEWLMASTEAR
jgi:diaminopimelate epimerase